jgi:LysR family hydrogen peroxide-inducible transcriptional activator
MVRAQPFAGAAPSRRVALAWRKSFPRLEAVDVLARAIHDAQLSGVGYLEQGQ